AIVGNCHMTAGGEDTLWIILAERPLNDVEIMSAEVGQLAAGIVGEPAELIETAIGVEWDLGGRAEPKVPVEAGRRVAIGGIADAVGELVTKMVALGDG